MNRSKLSTATLFLLLLPMGVMAQSSDSYEIRLAPHQGPAESMIITVDADQLEAAQCCLITLRRDGEAVAALQSHRIATIVNRSVQGEKLFQVIHQSGEIDRISADRMVPERNNGVVYFYVGGRLVGLASQNQSVMVVDESARLDAAGRPVRSPVRDSAPRHR